MQSAEKWWSDWGGMFPGLTPGQLLEWDLGANPSTSSESLWRVGWGAQSRLTQCYPPSKSKNVVIDDGSGAFEL